MSEHDDAGSAVTFPPLLPPPPPQPAAKSARTAAKPISAANENLLLTLPPPLPTRRVHRGPRSPRGRKYRPFRQPISTDKRRYSDPTTPKWRNWQTRRTQNPVGETPCGFDSHLRHSSAYDRAREGRRAH